MPTKINLLPVEKGREKKALQVVEVLNRISLVAGVIFLVVGIVGAVYLLYLRSQISNQVSKNNQLEATIQSLKVTEQKLILAKDRVGKIKTILSEKNVYDASNKVQKIFAGLPTDVTLEEANISIDGVRFNVTSRSSLGMVAFLNNLTGVEGYNQIVLRDFGFRPITGYSITVEAN